MNHTSLFPWYFPDLKTLKSGEAFETPSRGTHKGFSPQSSRYLCLVFRKSVQLGFLSTNPARYHPLTRHLRRRNPTKSEEYTPRSPSTLPRMEFSQKYMFTELEASPSHFPFLGFPPSPHMPHDYSSRTNRVSTYSTTGATDGGSIRSADGYESSSGESAYTTRGRSSHKPTRRERARTPLRSALRQPSRPRVHFDSSTPDTTGPYYPVSQPVQQYHDPRHYQPKVYIPPRAEPSSSRHHSRPRHEERQTATPHVAHIVSMMDRVEIAGIPRTSRHRDTTQYTEPLTSSTSRPSLPPPQMPIHGIPHTAPSYHRTVHKERSRSRNGTRHRMHPSTGHGHALSSTAGVPASRSTRHRSHSRSRHGRKERASSKGRSRSRPRRSGR